MSRDLYAEIDQSAVDKLLNSITYPFTIFDQHRDFPGCPGVVRKSDSVFKPYSAAQIDKMLATAVKGAVGGGAKTSNGPDDGLYALAGKIVQQSKAALEASSSANYTGPDKAVLKKIVDGGAEKLQSTVKPLGDFGLYPWCPNLRVVLRTRPAIGLAVPRIDLDNIRIEVTATGELWAKYPLPWCHRWCTQWGISEHCDRIASLTVSVDILADAHVLITAAGTKVLAQAVCDKLRLDYPILRDIPLEGFANDALGGKVLTVYDASALVETVPVLESRFAVNSVKLPNADGAIGVEVIIKQL
jgi:hypothetical protein